MSEDGQVEVNVLAYALPEASASVGLLDSLPQPQAMTSVSRQVSHSYLLYKLSLLCFLGMGAKNG